MKNKTVLITGASSGIGEACAELLGAMGANLILIARREDRLDALAQRFENSGVKVHTAALDVRDAALVSEFIQTLPEPFANIEILINNAGCALGLDPLSSADPKDSDAMIDINIKGLLHLTQAVLPQMLARKSGHIVNLGSLAAHNVYANGAVYCATKHAVRAITKALQLEVAGKGVRVTEIDPGAVETEFSLVRFKGDSARAKKVYESMQEPLTPLDVADAIIYALSCPRHVNISQIVMLSSDQTERLPS
jgi:3-hydroxy acid dehydrogenase / malonic semialdehyde reductase